MAEAITPVLTILAAVLLWPLYRRLLKAVDEGNLPAAVVNAIVMTFAAVFFVVDFLRERTLLNLLVASSVVLFACFSSWFNVWKICARATPEAEEQHS